MAFFTYIQNNSGGSFDFDYPLTHYMIIEADSGKAADSKLEDLGGYFDGCDEGKDCRCCGDRWYSQSDSKGEPFPAIYGSSILKSIETFGLNWSPKGIPSSIKMEKSKNT